MKNIIYTPNLSDIEITDPLFGSFSALVAETIIPYQWEILNDRVPGAEPSHCIENFRVAAGETAGEHQGVVFCDTDAYKWLEAAAYCIENGSGKRFEPVTDELIDLIGRAQRPDGYLNTYYTIAHPDQRWTNLAKGHELYSAGHLIEAAVAYYRATGKEKLLVIARRFADLICGEFGPEPGKRKGYPGHQEIELALVKLFRVTGENRYLELASFFINERGKEPNYLIKEMRESREGHLFFGLPDYEETYAQMHLPPARQTTAEGHAVRAMYLYSAMADVAYERGDEDLRTACRAVWKSVTQKRMFVTGGIGSSGFLERFTADYDLPNDRMYCETCASVGLMMFGQRMAVLMKDARYYDTVERALCNTVLAGISFGGDRYFYVNPLEVWPDNCLEDTSLAHVKPVRQPWFSVACCPTNIARTLASLGQYIYAQDEKSIYINQFISSRVHTELQGEAVSLEVDSTYMRDGCVRVTVESSSAHPFTIRVRIPEYFKQPVFQLEGKAIFPVVESGYAVLAVSRAAKQTFTVRGRVEPAFVAANENVRADAGKVSLAMGPYVYCLEQTDNGENLAGVYVSPKAKVQTGAPVQALPGELPTLAFQGERLTRSVRREDGDALYGTPEFHMEPAQFSAVPYCLWCNREPGEMLVWMKALI